MAHGLSGRGSKEDTGNVVFDVACLGDTFFADLGSAADLERGDLRGVAFNVEGDLYPADTIPRGAGQEPDAQAAVGHWLCRGFFILHPARPLPHVVTTQEYLFARISGQEPSPADVLVSSGVEGGIERTVRAVTGGAGRYRLVRGDGVQETIGTNSTVINGFGEPAPNFRFRFRLPGA